MRFFIQVSLLVALLLGLPGRSARADDLLAPPIPGWTHVNSRGVTAQGIVTSGRAIRYSAPAITDLDGDTSNGLEIAVGGGDGRLYVYRADGSLLWERDTPPCAVSAATNRLYSSPAIGDLEGDGLPDVVVGYGGFGKGLCDGGIVAFRGNDGAPLFTFSLKAFAKQAQFGTRSHAVFSSPALGDTDGDGKLEIAFGSFDRNVYLLEHNGAVRWYYNAADTILSSPTFADVDGDARLEVIIGTDISANRQLRPPTKNGGFVYALRSLPRSVKRIRFRDESAYVWKTFIPQVVYSSPVVADVVASSPGREVVVGSGCFFPQNSRRKTGRAATVLRLTDGAVVRRLKTAACFPSSAAIGDLNRDGVNDVVVTVQGSAAVGGSGLSRLVAFDVERGVVLWDVAPRTNGKNDPIGAEFNSPIIADIDGNGSLEVLVAHNRGISIHNGADGRVLSCTERDCPGPAPALSTKEVLRSTPAVADIDGDGILEVIIGSGFKTRGRLYGWTGLTLLGSDPGDRPPFDAPWPMWRGSPSHVTPPPPSTL